MLPIILLADDDMDDADLFCRAVKQTDPAIECHWANNGNEVLTQLTDKGNWRPDLILLDINMPIMNGWECLNVLKNDPGFSSIPVIMYSTSSHQQDVDRASYSGAACFFTKPHSYEKLAQVVQVIIQSVIDKALHAVCKKISGVLGN